MTLFQNINNWWESILKEEFSKDYFKKIEKKIYEDKESWITIFPKEENIFNAFLKTDFDDIKVVILWQDPYHGDNQAQWFSFSVPEWEKLPPSLKNIYKEINSSLWIESSSSWDLTPWTKQWVFLLNAVLTVQKAKPASHSKLGWEIFTDNVIKNISNKKDGVIFMLWWGFAQSKKKLIDENKHIILETSHPSPLWSYRWFLWSNCFKEVNEILRNRWEKEIDWEIKATRTLF